MGLIGGRAVFGFPIRIKALRLRHGNAFINVVYRYTVQCSVCNRNTKGRIKMPKHNAETIADALRKRICLEPPTSSPVLHEQALAVEFSVSRTPVRQALQRLAYERLVEVRSGVGTVVSPLEESKRDNDIELAFALLGVAAELEGDRPLSIEANAYIIALERQVSSAEKINIETNYTIRSTSLQVITREMSNDILAEALKAALWRLFRWRMAEAAQSPTGMDSRLPEVMERMAEATRIGTVRALLEAQNMPSSVT